MMFILLTIVSFCDATLEWIMGKSSVRLDCHGICKQAMKRCHEDCFPTKVTSLNDYYQGLCDEDLSTITPKYVPHLPAHDPRQVIKSCIIGFDATCNALPDGPLDKPVKGITPQAASKSSSDVTMEDSSLQSEDDEQTNPPEEIMDITPNIEDEEDIYMQRICPCGDATDSCSNDEPATEETISEPFAYELLIYPSGVFFLLVIILCIRWRHTLYRIWRNQNFYKMNDYFDRSVPEKSTSEVVEVEDFEPQNIQ